MVMGFFSLNHVIGCVELLFCPAHTFSFGTTTAYAYDKLTSAICHIIACVLLTLG